MKRKIYIVGTSTHCKDGWWDNNTSETYFSSRAKAAAHCEKWMANYKRDYPDGTASNPRDGVYHFNFVDGCIEEFSIVVVELN